MQCEPEWNARVEGLANQLRGDWSKADVIRLAVHALETYGKQIPELAEYWESP